MIPQQEDGNETFFALSFLWDGTRIWNSKQNQTLGVLRVERAEEAEEQDE